MALQQIKEDLLFLNYPNIQLMSDDEVAEVFSAGKRMVFLKWFLDKIGGFILPPDEKKLSLFMADTLSDLGLCLPSQKEKFLTGDLTLSIADQFTIFMQIIEYLKIEEYGKQKKKNQDFTMDDILACVNMDINLFRQDGPRKGISEKQRSLKMDGLEERIALLEKEVSELKESFPAPRIMIMESTDSSLESLQRALQRFTELDSFSLINPAETKGLFNETFEAKLTDCRTKLKFIVEYMKNINAMVEFQEGGSRNELVNFNANYLNIFEETASAARELIYLRNLLI